MNPTRLCFRVAELVFGVTYYGEGSLRHLMPSYKHFHLPDYEGRVDMEVTVMDGLVDSAPEGEELGQFDCGGAVHGVFRLPDKGFKFQLRNYVGTITAAVRTDERFSRVKVSLAGKESERAYGLNNTLMICFAYCAAYHRTVLLHASVAVRDGRGYLFLGKSGTGKSTHSQLWIRHLRGSWLLNDDNPAVCVSTEGQVTVYGTPWSGKTPCYVNRSVPVGAFVRLEQAPENSIAREPVTRAFASVLSSCSTMMWDKGSYSQICDTATAIISAVPIYYLRCLPDEAAARLSYDTVSRQ